MLNSSKIKKEIRFISFTSFRLNRIEIFDKLSNFINVSAYRLAYINIKDVIIFVAIRIKKLYNKRFRSKFFKIENLINLYLYREYKILAIKSKKLSL